MILALDTYYYKNKAKTVCVCFTDISNNQPIHIYSEIIEGVSAYEPGAFYKRELPCILSIFKQVDLSEVTYIIVDSFVILDDSGKFGLGGHLFEALDKKTPIIGVAKSGFHANKNNVLELLRGESKKPLYISAIGIELQTAYMMIKSMHGAYRMPTLLQLLDTKTKENTKDFLEG
ncbi:endonuclease V [Aquimarina aggregata]|uniref:endonuclease V n=1 Tax=Aquimarina aggregata TaxID=1642818 RepID=UPI0024930104|nr:endonuclease V [Aquimarina aggregata]